MDIEIIIGCEMHPNQVAEYAVAAEQAGVRTLWHSNITNGWDPFVALVPAAQVTSRIKLGVLALSPYEMHPLKIGYALASLNELSGGRALVGLGGGGAMAIAIVDKGDDRNLDFKKMRIVRGVREAAEIIYKVTSGQPHLPYKGEVFRVNQRFRTSFIKAPRPQIISCSMGPQMLRMGARVADGVQVGDVVPARVPDVMVDVQAGLARRSYAADDFRIGNFWAWHIKKDREQSMHEARRKLFSRAEIIPPHIGLDHLLAADEAQLVRDHFSHFLMADIDGSGEIKGVPPELVQRLIDEVSSAGDFDDIDREIARYKKFEEAGITDLAIRVFDEPLEALQTIRDRVMPHFS